MKINRYFVTGLLLLFISISAYAQNPADAPKSKTVDTISSFKGDSTIMIHDSAGVEIKPVLKSYFFVVDSLLSSNKFINTKDPAFFFIIEKRQPKGKEFIFYAVCVIVLILGIFRTFYNGYFDNLLKVFFNTTIRQNQLTDQLLQSALPSLILNVFFTISAGFYIWLVFKHYHSPKLIDNQVLLPLCILSIGVLYFFKYAILKLIGWMTGMYQATDNYIFVIFLVNKVAGIALVPFIIFIALGMPVLVKILVIISLILMGLFFLSRYLKTYGLLESRFPLNPLHFFIYIIAIEVIPLLVIYKILVDYVI
jgi:hypothetical protein